MSTLPPSQTQVSSLYSAFNTNQMAYKNYLNKLKTQLVSVKNNTSGWVEDDWNTWYNFWGDLSSMDSVDALEQQCKDLQELIIAAHPPPAQ